MTTGIIKPSATQWESVRCPCCGNPAEMRVVYDRYGAVTREYRKPQHADDAPARPINAMKAAGATV